MTGMLDIELVQDIERAVGNQRQIDTTVSGLTRASLPAILEYGCLRWAMPRAVPPLPSAIVSSPLGQALCEVRCELGLRDRGPQKIPPRDTNPRKIEFHIIQRPEDVSDNQLFEEYLLRFENAAKEVGFRRGTASQLNAAFCEMASNAVTHAKAPVPALLGYQVGKKSALFCVVDVGIGVLDSLRSNPAFHHLRLHTEAIRSALHEGVSGVAGPHARGMGFHQVFKALVENWGQLRFRSGQGCIQMDGRSLDADVGVERDVPYLLGFQVSVWCRVKSPYDST